MNSSKIFIMFVFLIVGANCFGDSLPNPSSFSNAQSYFDDCSRRGIAEQTCDMAARQYFPQDVADNDEPGDDQGQNQQDDMDEPSDSIASRDLVSRNDSNPYNDTVSSVDSETN